MRLRRLTKSLNSKFSADHKINDLLLSHNSTSSEIERLSARLNDICVQRASLHKQSKARKGGLHIYEEDAYSAFSISANLLNLLGGIGLRHIENDASRESFELDLERLILLLEEFNKAYSLSNWSLLKLATAQSRESDFACEFSSRVTEVYCCLLGLLSLLRVNNETNYLIKLGKHVMKFEDIFKEFESFGLPNERELAVPEWATNALNGQYCAPTSNSITIECLRKAPAEIEINGIFMPNIFLQSIKETVKKYGIYFVDLRPAEDFLNSTARHVDSNFRANATPIIAFFDGRISAAAKKAALRKLASSVHPDKLHGCEEGELKFSEYLVSSLLSQYGALCSGEDYQDTLIRIFGGSNQ